MEKRELKEKFAEAYYKKHFIHPIDWFWLRRATKQEVQKEAKELGIAL